MIRSTRAPRVLPRGLQTCPDPAPQFVPKRFDAPLVDEKRQPRPVPRRARSVIAKNLRDMAAQRRRRLGRHEDVQRRGGAVPAGAHLATDRNVEAVHVLSANRLDRGRQADVLRLRVHAVLGAARDGDVELAGQIGVRLVAEKRLREFSNDGRRVEQFARRETGNRTPDDIPDVVLAGLERHEPDALQPPPYLRHVRDLEPAQLNLLTRRDVRVADAVLPRDVGERPHLRRVREAVRDADAHHEAAGRLPAEEHANPLEALAIAFVDRFPTLLREPLDVGQDVEPVFLALELFDLVHDAAFTSAPGSPAIRATVAAGCG